MGVEDLDSTMKMLQHKGSVTGKSLAGDKETVEKPEIPVVPRKELVDDQMMDDLAEGLGLCHPRLQPSLHPHVLRGPTGAIFRVGDTSEQSPSHVVICSHSRLVVLNVAVIFILISVFDIMKPWLSVLWAGVMKKPDNLEHPRLSAKLLLDALDHGVVVVGGEVFNDEEVAGLALNLPVIEEPLVGAPVLCQLEPHTASLPQLHLLPC